MARQLKPLPNLRRLELAIAVELYDHFSKTGSRSATTDSLARALSPEASSFIATFIAPAMKNDYYATITSGFRLTDKGLNLIEKYGNDRNSGVGRYLEFGTDWVFGLGSDPSTDVDPIPAADRYVSRSHNAAVLDEAIADVERLREAIRGDNDADAELQLQAISEIAAFEATLSQPRVPLELVERFVSRVITWITKHFSDALVGAVAAALVAKLLPFLN